MVSIQEHWSTSLPRLHAEPTTIPDDNPHYPDYEFRLSPGWIFGRQVVRFNYMLTSVSASLWAEKL
jgi:hypothetical protein